MEALVLELYMSIHQALQSRVVWSMRVGVHRLVETQEKLTNYGFKIALRDFYVFLDCC